MTYKRHFSYEVRWAGEYYSFNYMQDVRRFLRRKTGYAVIKNLYNDNGDYIGYRWIEEG